MIVRLDNVTVARRGRRLLDAVSLELRAGQRVALIGPNGAGKSTLLRVIAGVERVDSGSVDFDGRSVARLAGRERAQTVSLMLADASSVFGFTGLERVLLGRTPRLGAFGLPGDGDVALALELLARLEAAELGARSLTTLSTGEKQRVAFAATLAQDADCVLLDEPTSALDLRGVAIVLRELDALAARGRIVVAAMHDLNSVLGRFDRAVLVDGGRVVADGPVVEVVASREARAAWSDGFELVQSDAGPVVIPRRGALTSVGVDRRDALDAR